MIALVATADGTFGVDLDDATRSMPGEPFDAAAGARRSNLPRVVAAAAAGSTVVAVVDAPPADRSSRTTPARTWRESGRGLPPGRAIAVARTTPTRSSTRRATGSTSRATAGVFWDALAVELPEIEAVAVDGDDWNSPRATTTAEPPTEHPLDPLGRAVDAGVELRRPADLDALRRSRSPRRTPIRPCRARWTASGPAAEPGRRILGDAERRARTSRVFQPPPSRAKQLTPAVGQRAERA